MNVISVEARPRQQMLWPAGALFSASLVVFALFFALLLNLSGNDGLLRDPDSFWHIGLGRQIVQTGSFPWTDELSYTFQGHPWIAKEWLSQVIYFLAYEAGGWPGVVIIASAAVALTYTLLFAELAGQMRLTVALSMTMLAYALSSGHFLARPHLLSYPCLILWVVGLVRAVEGRRYPSLLLLPVMALWANLHGGFTLGLGIGGLLALEAIFSSRPENRLRAAFCWGLFLAAALIASLVTPYGYHSVWVTAQVFGGNQALDHIAEWRAIDFGKANFIGLLIIGVIFLGFLVGVKIKFMRLVVVTILFYMMLVHIRLIPIFAMVTPLMIASSLRGQFPSLSLQSQSGEHPELLDKLVGRLRPQYALLLSALVVGSSLLALPVRGIHPHESITPAAAVDYILRTDPDGRLYNDYDFGGYLIFRGIKTFIDGRSDQLFGSGFLTRTFESLKKPNDDFLNLLDEYHVSSALVGPNSSQALKLDRSPSWQCRYADKIAAVCQRIKL